MTTAICVLETKAQKIAKNTSNKGQNMNTWDFNNCRFFLQDMIYQKEDNINFIKAYEKLIEEKTKYDIAIASQNIDIQKNWNICQKETMIDIEKIRANTAK